MFLYWLIIIIEVYHVNIDRSKHSPASEIIVFLSTMISIMLATPKPDPRSLKPSAINKYSVCLKMGKNLLKIRCGVCEV